MNADRSDTNASVAVAIWRIITLADLRAAMNRLIAEQDQMRRDLRDLNVKHARARAALTAWEIECWHELQEQPHD